ncbi:MAG: zinc-binding dehydrogenase [Gammaproteobacteria bacterium]|nr:zinc-binding dehydrogenase [Gammaproteobacteria bacterium]
MKAAVIREFGDFDVLQLEEVPTPKPRPGHILIKVLAAGINRLEDYLREGSVVPELAFPHILGADAAGEVAAFGEGVKGFQIGERVVHQPGFPTDPAEYNIRPATTAASFTLPGLAIPGTYAQYVEIPAEFVLKDETGLSPEEVATLPMVLATGVRAVKTVGGVKAGDKVLVQAGAGGAGSMQIQIAKALGAEVATTIRDAEKADVARKAGADLIINTTEEDFVAKVQEWSNGGAHVVIDSLGGDVLAKSIDAARPLGTIVAFGFVAGTQTTFDMRNFFFTQKKLLGTMAGDIEDLKWGLAQVKEGYIKPMLDRALPLSQAGRAHRLLASSQVAGNIVLLPWAA